MTEAITVTKLADLDVIQFGQAVNVDAYVKWPDPPQTDKQLETLDEDMAKAQARMDKITARIENALVKRAEEAAAEKEKSNNGQGQEKKGD